MTCSFFPAQNAVHIRPIGGKIDQFRRAFLEFARPDNQKKNENEVRNEKPKIDVGVIELAVNQDADEDQINDDCGRHEAVTQPSACEAFRTAVIFGHSLEHKTPPEISINLNVPFIPAAVRGITPALFFQKPEDRAKQMMPILSFFAPITATTQTTREP